MTTPRFRSDVFVYLSGPITARDGYTVEDNVAHALTVYLRCIRAGITCYCPHLGAAFPSAWVDVPYDQWLAYDFAIIDRCTHVLLLPRWETSPGAQQERAYAIAQGKTIVGMEFVISGAPPSALPLTGEARETVSGRTVDNSASLTDPPR